MAKTAQVVCRRGAKIMRKSAWQQLLDTLLFLNIVGLVFVGFLMGLALPKGPSAPESAKYFLGLHRHQWGNIHLYLSIAFTVLVIIHLIFSWKWIKSKARQVFKKGWGTALILTVIASILVLFLFWSLYPRIPGAYEDYGRGAGKKARQQQLSEEGYPITEEKGGIQEKQEKKEEEHEQKLTRGVRAEDQSGLLITGKMNLYDIEKKTGIPARKMAEKLGLPSNAPLDESLGRLRKRYIFTMQDVRDVLASLMEK